MAHRVKKAVFPVGGLGTRFLPATKCMPKEMLPIASKPLVQHAFEEAAEAGIEQFIFITGRNKDAISHHFDHSYELEHSLEIRNKYDALAQVRDWLPSIGQIAFVRQREPLGLGHAIWSARNFIGNDPFAIILADELYLTPQKGVLSQMVETFHEMEAKSNLIAVAEVPLEDTKNYGIIRPSLATIQNSNKIPIAGMVEKPKPADAPSCYAITGRYILQPEVLDVLASQERGSGNEIQLTDAMASLVTSQPYHGFIFDGKRFDCGNPVGFLEANIAFALADPAMRPHVERMMYQHG